ncbi:MAG TPA: sigma 54-interacting transcriptional regulator [Tepidisphaeraceae bacterium]|jgi:PAS domain S-box-containing protein|nr:sigma 54-interacting transcriptional regulator [Tepidisphaeraceae bacterium]
MSTASNERARPDESEIDALRAIVEGTARSTGDEFFKSLVQHLAAAMDVHYAFVAEFAGSKTRARTLGYWYGDHIHENIEWDLPGTPCEDVVGGNLCHYPEGTARKFPKDEALVKMGIESYLGVPLKDPQGKVLGHLAVFDQRPMPPEDRRMYLFHIFASRAAAELQRLRAEEQVRESEQRYRDLYDEAPIAYIYEDLESRFVRANCAACKLLGLHPDDVVGSLGKSFLAPTKEVKQTIEKALAAMKDNRKEISGIELELRRKDDGRPVWVQWYSKPEPDGKHTRTMLIDITERVLMEREKARLQEQNQYLQEEIKSVHNFEEIVGISTPLRAVLDNVRQVAPTDTSVLITGETGTGKELFARAIHSASNRRDKPLIKVNCAALPTGLVESELFGHERGAFSGAISRRIGRFELASGGTIFLDEIGEIPLDVQVKLLRVLQERECERVGGNVPIKVDVRIIAATNRDLRRAVQEGKFREDLYYRLSVFPLHLPPLRERSGDLPLLVQFLVNKFAMRIGKRITGLSPDSMKRLGEYRWPGNVRELENILERAVILSGSPVLKVDPSTFAPSPTTTRAESGDLETGLESVERNHILEILRRTDWVIEGSRGAARLLDLHPNTLRSRMKRLGISRIDSHEGS